MRRRSHKCSSKPLESPKSEPKTRRTSYINTSQRTQILAKLHAQPSQSLCSQAFMETLSITSQIVRSSHPQWLSLSQLTLIIHYLWTSITLRVHQAYRHSPIIAKNNQYRCNWRAPRTKILRKLLCNQRKLQPKWYRNKPKNLKVWMNQWWTYLKRKKKAWNKLAVKYK